MTIRASFPSLRPSLDLNFARTKRLDPRVTFGRPSTATYVDAGGVLRTAAANAPRFDHNPTTGESLGLLVEESRTNLLLRSEEFGTSPWAASNATVTPNQAVAPDGTATADLLTKSVAYGAAYQITDVASLTAHTVSFYVKKATNQYASLAVTDNAAANIITRAYINLDTGVVTNAAGTTVADPVGNGWYRVSSSFSYTNALNRIYLYPGIYSDTSTGGIYLWGAQLEAGSFPTSYIKNVDTPGGVTRVADVVSITGTNFSSWYRQDEGTVFSSFSIPTALTTGGSRVYNISNSGFTSQIWLRLQGGTNRLYEVTDSSTQQAALSAGTFSARVMYKGAVGIKANNFGFSDSGSNPISDTAGTLGSVDRMGIGMDSNGTAPLNGHIQRLTFWPQRLGNEVLQRITQ